MNMETMLTVLAALVAIAGGVGVGRYWLVKKAGQVLSAAREVRDVIHAADALSTQVRLECKGDSPARTKADDYEAEKDQAEAALKVLFSR